MNSINADLHCHSVISDGTLTPEDLALRAKRNGVELWALTDHDEIGGQARAMRAAKEIGIDYLGGVEISVSWAGQTVHIVGLGIDFTDQVLIDGLKKTRDGRALRGKQMAEDLVKVGIPGAYEGALQFAGNSELLSRTHFARFIVDRGFCKTTEEVFRKYLIEGKPGFVAHVWASLEEAVVWIKAAGGQAVIAHPGRYRLNELQLSQLYDTFKELGGQGLEVITGSHSVYQYDEFEKVATKYNFYASRGSDFHDPDESHIDLGKLPNLPDSVKPIWELFK
jgi:predicted metal-dependent phosphoesterase TrpH